MRKLIIALMLVAVVSLPSYALKYDVFNCLSGGTAGCLDHWDGSALSDGDVATVVVSPSASYVCSLDADSAEDELLTGDTPIIAPDNNAGDKRWLCLLIGSGGEGGTDDQTAEEVPFTPTVDIDSENVQDAIEEVQSHVSSGLPANFSDSGGDILAEDGAQFLDASGDPVAQINDGQEFEVVGSLKASAINPSTIDFYKVAGNNLVDRYCWKW